MNKYLKRAFTQDRYYTPERFQHCSTICSFKGGTLVSFYAGERECHNSQRVMLFWNKLDGSQTPIHELESLSGNPILIANARWDKAKIVYSEFTKFPANLAAWWQHCKLWVREVSLVNGDLVISDRKPVIVEEPFEGQPPDGTGYLPRCHPIQFGDETLLPLYREHEPNHHGVIMASKNGIDWEYRGSIGRGVRCIQPTIWNDNGKKLCALLRNFNRGYGQKAYYSESVDSGKTWSDPIESQFYNANNSILALECYDSENLKTETLFVWNDDPKGRDKICLGDKNRALIQLDSYGSYPAACLSQGKIHVTYTAKANLYKFPHARLVIKHKVFDTQRLILESRRFRISNVV